ncbi:hypothetical protein SAMN05660284_00374 [Formivibrio citricus]|uniref:Uncharacterized protein n=1 Tax=Formivibrio citricus TaxID=83765 RepID=A0A1I4VTD9_9NEIS|nr:hypothetical protein [Formivibrio citricus]SFN04453.1 hypothetical protein SAMN05660284_00374 [Formivibrio citricus]
MQLLLDLPEVNPELAKAVETNPKRLKDWLIGLPASDVIECGRFIFDALASLNRIELGVDERVALLSEYETMLDVLAGGFEATYASAGLPMKDRARQAALLYRNLWLEMSMGWKVALVNRMEKRGLFSSGKVEPFFVQRVLYCYWRFFRINCRLFMPMPKGIWSEAHQMFRLGAENKFLDEPTEPKNRSIATIYKRLLLLSLADPLRFAPLEQDKVVDIVENYGHLAHFQPLSKLLNTAGYFLVELDSDKAPYFVGNRTSDLPTPVAILLETGELSRHLHKTEAAIEAKTPLAHDRARVLARLQILRRAMRQWAISPQRTYQRIASQTLVDIAFGIRSVVTQLNDGKMMVSPQTAPDLDENQETPAPEGRLREVLLSKWQVLNESPGGYAVRSLAIADEQVRAGDIVALRAFPEAAWMIASVRWLQQDEENCIEMGLQVLSSRAVPALVRPTIATEGQHYLPALLLPEISILKQPARIAATKGTYTPLRELSILTPDGERKVRATRLIEQQMSYDLFDFQAS